LNPPWGGDEKKEKKENGVAARRFMGMVLEGWKAD